MTTEDLSLPRILCLHGGGVNSTIFRLQCRSFLASALASHFRFVFVDGPTLCEAHPAVEKVYGDYGPFYRWLRFEKEHPKTDAGDAAFAVLSCCRAAMDADAGTGEWVGVLGFSQGSKIAASLLWLAERVRKRDGRKGQDGKAVVLPVMGLVNFQFGVIFAGSAPLTALDPDEAAEGVMPPHMDSPGEVGMLFTDWPESDEGEHSISTPTLHVHGIKDPGIERHKVMLGKYCRKGSTTLVEWDGDHRLPFKKADVDLVVSKILEVAGKSAS